MKNIHGWNRMMKGEMSDRDILDKYVDLEKSCLSDSKKKQIMDMLYKYKDAFHLRDEMGTCLNIEVEIDVIDKSPFFIRPYHVKEEDKNILDKEMKRLFYLGILKERFSAYLSPVMLINRKVTKDQREGNEFPVSSVWDEDLEKQERKNQEIEDQKDCEGKTPQTSPTFLLATTFTPQPQNSSI